MFTTDGYLLQLVRLRLPNEEIKKVLTVMCMPFRDEEPFFYLTIQELSRASGCSLLSTKKAIGWLEQLAIIEKVHDTDTGSSMYWLNEEMLCFLSSELASANLTKD